MMTPSSPRFHEQGQPNENSRVAVSISTSTPQIELPPLSTGTITTEELSTSDDHVRRRATLMKNSSSMEPMIYPPSSSSVGSSTTYRSSYFRTCCTFQNFCYCVQIVNCALVVTLIILAVQEYPKIEALEQQVEDDKDEIATLEEEVREKQEGQIQELNQEVAKEQQFNFLTLAGTFTLLTCLISMFHMSTHLQKMYQPQIQRKIIAILWMSPIYSVTSFLTLWFPSVTGWMAIIKDFYEAYCIYTFLSFLIAVLGEGSRDKAVDVLTRHASNLEKPTKCLACFYEPPPEVSDHAKANAVVTQCQIYCMQFTFLRPLTTVIYVLLNRNREGTSGGSSSSSSNTDTGSTSASQDSTSNSTSISHDTSSDTTSESGTTSSSTAPQQENHTGTRMLIQEQMELEIRLLRKHHQLEETEQVGNNATKGSDSMDSESGSNLGGSSSSSNPQMDNTLSPNPAPNPGTFASTFAPSIVSNVVDTLVPTVAAGIAGSLPSGNGTINEHGTGYPVSPPSLAPTIFVNETSSEDFYESTKAYFRSPGFALAMVVNVSVFFAFAGLVKFYHAVRDDLSWCRPWPKFLTIKGVVFVTFWQGLMILIFVVVLADPNEKLDATYRAHQYQNILICMEMLFFAIFQWCVFPAEEWEPDYQPRQMETPGLGIKDFVNDVGHIVQNRSGRSRRARRRISRRKKSFTGAKVASNSYDGLYHQPGTATVISTQYDGVEENGDSSVDSEDVDSIDDESNGFDGVQLSNDDTTSDDSPRRQARTFVRFGNLPPSSDHDDPHYNNRNRTMSDGTGDKADDELDSDDLELL